MTKAYIWDHGQPNSRVATDEEYKEIKEEIYKQIAREGEKYIYSHTVRYGSY